MLQRHLTLDDIGTCILKALDNDAELMIEKLSQIMHLQCPDAESGASRSLCQITFNIRVDGPLSTPLPIKPPLVSFKPFEAKNSELVTIRGVANPDVRMAALSLVAVGIARHFEYLGGGLIHGALIVRNGCGVILAGPSQVGKSTACARLPMGWHALSDDTTLIVPTSSTYHAHPWPTWSRHMFDGPGGSWDVRKRVLLKSIFFLKRGEIDKVQPMGQGEAACMLMRATQQIGQVHLPGLVPKDLLQKLRNTQFSNVCQISRLVPSWHLTISPEGRFHDEIDRALQESHRETGTK